MKRVFLNTAAVAALVTAGTPALAQGGLEGRVSKLESEVRAVQRKVFPGGAGATVEPQITPQGDSVAAIGTPASSALADLTARVTALETQQRTLTGQMEQTQYRLRQLEDSFAAYRKSTDERIGGSNVTVPSAPKPVSPSISNDRAETTPTPAKALAPAKPATGDPARARLVAAVERPSTGEAGEDAYLYGYRLWAAKLYPEAETQLKSVVASYPKHRRASYAQNLLGRSYLDEGKPSLASIAFYDNYKKYPDGERAPESLYYLGSALMKLNKPADACKVYGELTDVFSDRIDAGMKARVATARTAAKCK